MYFLNVHIPICLNSVIHSIVHYSFPFSFQVEGGLLNNSKIDGRLYRPRIFLTYINKLLSFSSFITISLKAKSFSIEPLHLIIFMKVVRAFYAAQLLRAKSPKALKDMYTDCSSRIKWAGGLSDPINIKQGVRQGGVLSTGHYKRYNNPLLLQLEQRYTGIKVGSINIPHVAVADDLAVLSSFRSEKQVIVWDVEGNAGRERFFVNPSLPIFKHAKHAFCFREFVMYKRLPIHLNA